MTIDKRILGLDIGKRRIGVALGDPLGILASPHSIIKRYDDVSAVAAIAELAAQNDVGQIVVGLPLSLDGGEGKQVAEVKAFTTQIKTAIDLPLVYCDERLSTITAQELLKKGGSKRIGGADDAAAAAVILQSYLEENRSRRPKDED
jgi:putative Holliday junction resolvase